MLQREYMIDECLQGLEMGVAVQDDFGARIANALVRFEVCRGPDEAGGRIEKVEMMTDKDGEVCLIWACGRPDEPLTKICISCDEPGAFVRYSRVMLLR